MGHNHPVIDADPHFKIDKTTRAITDASGKQSVLMQGDHNSERYTFEIPRYIDGHDMSLCDLVEIHYVNTDSNKRTENKGIYIVDDLQVSETQPDEVVQFTWLISNAVTVNAGPLSFLIRFSCTEGGKTIYAWNTGINKDKSISLSMYNADTIQQEQPDLIAHIEEAIKGKLDSKNRTPDKFLGTDGAGKVIDKDISYSDVKNTPSKLPNPQKLTISGYATGTYDGSSAVTIQIPTPDIPSKVSQLQNDSNFANQTEVGNKVNEHNVNNQSHNDIRLSIKGLTDRLNTLMDSEDVSLDQLSEIVTYIKNNKSLIDGITTNKLNVTDVVNNFTTNVTTKALSASMGVELKRLIDAIKIPDVAGQINAHNTSGTSHKDIRDEVAKKAGKSTTLSGYGITDGATKSELSGHNTNSSAHNDIRELVAKLTERLNTVANSSDVSLDQLSEIVSYIKNNKTLIEQVTTNKLNVTDVVNNLTTNVESKALSAAMGVELKGLIDSIKTTDASAQISEHDKSKTAHADIRTDVTTLKEDFTNLKPRVDKLEKDAQTYSETFFKNFFAMQRTGKVYTVRFPLWETSQVATGEKLDDNEGLVMEASTLTEKGRDDYSNIPLFKTYDCNVEQFLGKPKISAMRGDKEFDSKEKDTFVLSMSYYHKFWIQDGYMYYSRSDSPHEGYVVCSEAKKKNGERPFCLYAKYVTGANSKGELGSFYGKNPTRSKFSFNSSLSEAKKRGTGYIFGCSADYAYIQNTFMLKYANKNWNTVLGGNFGSANNQFLVSKPESDTKRVVLTKANAEKFPIGSCVSVGDLGQDTNKDRGNAKIHNICDNAKVIDIVDVDGTNKALVLDIKNNITTTTTTWVTSMHWRSGFSDRIKGTDGCPCDAKSQISSMYYPTVFQGIELAVGGYEVLGNAFMDILTDPLARDTYVCDDSEKLTNSVSTAKASWKKVAKQLTVEKNNAWCYGTELHMGLESGINVITKAGASGSGSNTGFCDGVYFDDGVNTQREFLLLGHLGDWGICGAFFSYGSGWLGGAGWYVLARLSLSIYRGEFA